VATKPVNLMVANMAQQLIGTAWAIVHNVLLFAIAVIEKR
jgi:hypothetical protein